MSVNELREWCKEVQDDPVRLDDGYKEDSSDFMILGAMIALGIDNPALCFGCSGCELPICWNQGLYSETMFQFRS
jgi:hypothetical protein